MRDDERYPQVVEDQSFHAPEVVHSHQFDVHGREKLSPSGTENGLILPKYSPGDGTGWEPPVPPVESKRWCGLKKRTFIIVIAVVTIIVIGAIVGGVVGGLQANKSNEKSDQIPTTSTTSTAPNLPTQTAPTTPTGPLSEADRNIAASASSSTKEGNVQFFYQDLETNDILYRLIWNDTSRKEQRLALPITPNVGTSLAVTATKANSSDPVTVKLYYISTHDSTKLPAIAEASLQCQSNSEACELASNVVISTNVTDGVHPKTSLTAILLDDNSIIRVYYQAKTGHVWVLNGDNAEKTGWSMLHFAGPAYPGTGIVAYKEGNATENVNVFFVSNETNRLRVFEYKDIIGPPDGAGKPVDDSPGSGWQPWAKLSAAFVPNAEARDRLYYVAPATGDIVGNFKSVSIDSWRSAQTKGWGKATGGITSVGWLDQVRLLYFEDGKWVMQRWTPNNWRDPIYL